MLLLQGWWKTKGNRARGLLKIITTNAKLKEQSKLQKANFKKPCESLSFMSYRLLILAVILIYSMGCSKPLADFDAAFHEAESEVGVGHLDAAVHAYEKLAEDFPDSDQRSMVLIRLAQVLAVKDGDVPAVKVYDQVIKEYPLTAAGRLARERRAELLMRRGDFDGAIVDYSAILKHFAIGDDRCRYIVGIGNAYLSSKNLTQTRDTIFPLLSDKKTPKECRERALFISGESYFLGGEPLNAAKFYEALLDEFPNSSVLPEVKLHLATCAEELGYLGLARNITTDAKGGYPNEKVIGARLKSLDVRGTQAVENVPGKKAQKIEKK